MLVIPPSKEVPMEKEEVFRGLHFIHFIFALTVALPTYIMSTFLTTFAIERTVGLLYTAGAILSFILITLIPRMLARFGNYAVAFSLSVAVALLTLPLAFVHIPWIVFLSFVSYNALLNVIFFTQDVFIERFSTDARTGSIRGTFLTLTNIAFLISPFMAGSILTNGDYWKIFSLTTVTITSVAFLFTLYLRNFKDAEYERVKIITTLKEITRRKNVFLIFIVNFLLRFFYAWMVIYSPLYLHNQIGLPWNEIGIIFTIMLVPFVLLALPAGHIADKHVGEKELLFIGFLIAGISTIFISTIDASAELSRWILVFAVTRIGASIIETMSETYFFKHIHPDDTHVIGVFRNTNSLAYIVGPALASLTLFFLPFSSIFLVLGIILLVMGLPVTLMLKDTK
ncbi:MAG: MFS transporter [Candidatus Yonathbacteria bacterium]|nr:MFS transporter [Candidatus Yonathbacteria bacterium]